VRKLLLATTCAVGVAAPIAAAQAAPVSTWTGCYIGANAGAGWGKKNFSDQFLTPGVVIIPGFVFITPSSPLADTSGWLAGGQVGCDLQFAPNWVLGIEGAGAWADISGRSDPFFHGKTIGGEAVFYARTDWLASVTARLGYTVEHWLLFIKGGPAWAGDRYRVPGFAANPFNFTASETRSGVVFGGGLEWFFAPNWTFKVEYAYYDFGTRTLTLIDQFDNFNPDTARIRQRIQTVTFGVNFRFATGPR
jgi:outer membrane immunogenic protein